MFVKLIYNRLAPVIYSMGCALCVSVLQIASILSPPHAKGLLQ